MRNLKYFRTCCDVYVNIRLYRETKRAVLIFICTQCAQLGHVLVHKGIQQVNDMWIQMRSPRYCTFFWEILKKLHLARNF